MKHLKALMLRAIVSFSVRNRRKKAGLIDAFASEHECKTVLLTGVMGQPNGANADIIEAAVSDGREVRMGINVYPAADTFAFPYPFQVADARDMPFEDDFVDFALASAIIEHVGDEGDQRRFVAEHTRVARAWAITTPNKWFPIESHTGAVCMHWVPRWRARQDVFTRLLSRREFKAMLPAETKIIGRPWSPTFTALYAKVPPAATRAERPVEGH